MLHFLFPTEPMSKLVDTEYQNEYNYLNNDKKSVVDIELKLNKKDLKLKNKIIIWRGWMLSYDEYFWLNNYVEKNGGKLQTQIENYFNFHYITGWINSIYDLTFKTFIFKDLKDLKTNFNFNNKKYLIKDYVKSSNNPNLLFASNIEKTEIIIKEILKYKDKLEGGLVLRTYKKILPKTEKIFFIYNNEIFSSNNKFIPEIVKIAVKRINSNLLYSIDIVQLSNKKWIIVEIGDGQVSGLKEWKVADFYKIFNYLIIK